VVITEEPEGRLSEINTRFTVVGAVGAAALLEVEVGAGFAGGGDCCGFSLLHEAAITAISKAKSEARLMARDHSGGAGFRRRLSASALRRNGAGLAPLWIKRALTRPPEAEPSAGTPLAKAEGVRSARAL
jgi:hypothetical protein